MNRPAHIHVSLDTNRKAAGIAGVEVRELGNALLEVGTGHVWDIGAPSHLGDHCRAILIDALGLCFGIGLCCSAGSWFLWSERLQKHIGTDDYPSRTVAAIAAVRLINWPLDEVSA